jgi:hypothetical protein
MIPDSAVEIDTESEVRAFPCKGNGVLPLSLRRTWVQSSDGLKLKRFIEHYKKDFETLPLDAFATPGPPLAQPRW